MEETIKYMKKWTYVDSDGNSELLTMMEATEFSSRVCVGDHIAKKNRFCFSIHKDGKYLQVQFPFFRRCIYFFGNWLMTLVITWKI